MGHTRILFTDATTAEAISVLKTCGFMETPKGGCFFNQDSPLKVYRVWVRAKYYPYFIRGVVLSPRNHIHFKSKHDSASLTELLQTCVQGFLRLSDKTRIKAFDANTGKEIRPALLKG